MIRLAQKASTKSKEKFRLGAAITKGKRVLAVGHNDRRSHPMGSGIFKSVHAECAVICQCLQKRIDMTGATLWVYRTKTDGPGMARPCPDCMELIKSVGITDVRYTDRGGSVTHERI
jgi:deoxycytidylate deaminase